MTGCRSNKSRDDSTISSQKDILLGTWKKITDTKCSEIYPDELEFLQKGIYFGKKPEWALTVSYWDAGTYQILTEDRVKISTANDEEVNYNFSLTADGILNFVDRNGCKFRYRRL